LLHQQINIFTDMQKSQVVIVDDHQLFRNGLKFIIGEIDTVEVVAEASNGKEFLELLKRFKPDIVLMDINMPEMNGVDATKEALRIYPDLKILVLSMFSDDQYYNTMIETGVKGFILKDCDTKELKNAIKNILEGNTFFSQELLIKLIRNKNNDQRILLTKREQEVLTLICKGFSTIQISQNLNISDRTVERHRANLLVKTESTNSISLVIYAIKNNLVRLD